MWSSVLDVWRCRPAAGQSVTETQGLRKVLSRPAGSRDRSRRWSASSESGTVTLAHKHSLPPGYLAHEIVPSAVRYVHVAHRFAAWPSRFGRRLQPPPAPPAPRLVALAPSPHPQAPRLRMASSDNRAPAPVANQPPSAGAGRLTVAGRWIEPFSRHARPYRAASPPPVPGKTAILTFVNVPGRSQSMIYRVVSALGTGVKSRMADEVT